MRQTITSLQNPQIKNLVKLRQRRQRDQQGLMLIDGLRPLTLALNNKVRLQTLFFVLDQTEASFLNLASTQGTILQPVTHEVFKKISYGNTPDGYLGLAAQPTLLLETLPRPAQPLYLVAEGIEKPGNLGAILRSADAANITGLIVADNHTDIYNPNVIRASQGAFFTVPIAISKTDIAIRWLHEANIRIVAATPTGSRLYTVIDFCQPTAIVVGREHCGLSKAWLDQTLARIPMVGQVDSLNVAQTATILIFEAVRQRRLVA